MATWLELPLVEAPSPDDKEKLITLQISDEFIGKNALARKRTPIFQLWAHVVGELPPINNIAYLSKFQVRPQICSLKESVACFRGVQRPLDNEDDGQSVLTYILNPLVSIAYEGHMVCVAKAVKVPALTAATVQVRPVEGLQIDGKNVSGTVTRFEFVTGENAGNVVLPEGYLERYGGRLW